MPLALVQQKGILSVDLAPDDRRLAAGYADGRVKLWSFPAGQHEATYRQHYGWVFGVCFSEDGRVLASGGEDRYRHALGCGCPAGVGNLATSYSRSTERGLFVGWPTFGHWGGGAGDAVKLWDLATHRELLTLPAEGFFFSDLTFSPDGNTLVATSLSGIAHFWRAPSWRRFLPTDPSCPPGNSSRRLELGQLKVTFVPAHVADSSCKPESALVESVWQRHSLPRVVAVGIRVLRHPPRSSRLRMGEASR